ncbi:MAG: competence/damage-inducible protein A [Bacteroidia bacterium]|nr:competence/damage-inducible protein A [Bacteroidia bacterium]
MKSIKAEIITIGDELLIGQIVDTNSAWIGRQLNLIGISVYQLTSVSDNQDHILTALQEAAGRAEIILITGGLGPTKDDLTKTTLCAYFKTSLVFNEEAYKDVEHLFKIRGREVTPINRMQAELPSNCSLLSNKVGTAPGMWFDEGGVVYVSMPGVPYEMKYLMEKEVLPRLKGRFETPYILHRTLLTQGIGESFLSELIAGFEDKLPPHVKLAYLPAAGMVRLRLSASGEETAVKKDMENLVHELSGLVKEYLFGYDEDSIEQVLGRLLQERGLTIATAESCTGGNIAHLLTSVPGSSAWYMGSTVTYSYKSKTEILGIPEDLMLRHGAVSEEVVLAMVESVKKLMGTDCALATSGVAGPGGGTPDKPVGTVWIGVSLPGKTFAKKVMLGDNRLRTIEVASETALNMLRKALLSSNL